MHVITQLYTGQVTLSSSPVVIWQTSYVDLLVSMYLFDSLNIGYRSI